MMRKLLRGFVRAAFKPMLRPNVPVAWQRRWVAAVGALNRAPRGVEIERQIIGAVTVERLRARGRSPATVLLFLHGGGFVVGSPATHRALAARLARLCSAVVVVPDYRLAPEHPCPAALDDALTVYRALRSEFGSVVLAGDSAGGGLALALALALRDAGERLPERIALLSPWVDLSLSGESVTGKAALDPMLGAGWLRDCSERYRAQRAAQDAVVSPLFADLSGLPPLLVHVGSDEILLSDAQRLADRAGAAGVTVELQVWEGLWHDFQLHAGMLREADQALAQIAEFLLDDA